MYEEIKNNFIEKFLNPYYKFTVGVTKESILHDIYQRCYFPCSYYNDTNILRIFLGNNINVDICLGWEERNNKNNMTYRLISIS